MKIRVKVTYKDIAHGKRDDCVQCPVALALKRQGFVDPQVYMDTVLLKGSYYNLPTSATNFIMNFDRGNLVDELAFTLESR